VRRTYLTATVIAVLIGIWFLSGLVTQPRTPPPPTLAEGNAERAAARDDRPPTMVRARVLHAEPRYATVSVRGRTETKRTVNVRAETGGRVVERPIERGSRVAAGDLLCRLAIDDRDARLHEALETLAQAQVDYDGSRRLAERGLQSESAIATQRARVAAAAAQVARAQLDLSRTELRAPFAGIVDDVALEIGDITQPGTVCATVIDLDPLLLVGRVAERDVTSVALASEAEATLLDGRQVSGRVAFVGSRSDTATRTYPVEIEIDNPDYLIRSGVTAHIRIPVETISAHRVSAALLALDDSGRLGIRTLNGNDRVEFNLVEILGDDGDSIWVAGLPRVATVITVGQELVIPGERVRVSFDDAVRGNASELEHAVRSTERTRAQQ
jgi:membrane fusion protein, multidrug efflux system